MDDTKSLSLEPIHMSTIGVPSSNDSDNKRSTSSAITSSAPPSLVEVTVKDEWYDRVIVLRNSYGRYVRNTSSTTLSHHEHQHGHYQHWRWLPSNQFHNPRIASLAVAAGSPVGTSAALPVGAPHVLVSTYRYIPTKEKNKKKDAISGDGLQLSANGVIVAPFNCGRAIWNGTLWSESVGNNRVAFRTIKGTWLYQSIDGTMLDTRDNTQPGCHFEMLDAPVMETSCC